MSQTARLLNVNGGSFVFEIWHSSDQLVFSKYCSLYLVTVHFKIVNFREIVNFCWTSQSI